MSGKTTKQLYNVLWFLLISTRIFFLSNLNVLSNMQVRKPLSTKYQQKDSKTLFHFTSHIIIYNLIFTIRLKSLEFSNKWQTTIKMCCAPSCPLFWTHHINRNILHPKLFSVTVFCSGVYGFSFHPASDITTSWPLDILDNQIDLMTLSPMEFGEALKYRVSSIGQEWVSSNVHHPTNCNYSLKLYVFMRYWRTSFPTVQMRSWQTQRIPWRIWESVWFCRTFTIFIEAIASMAF